VRRARLRKAAAGKEEGQYEKHRQLCRKFNAIRCCCAQLNEGRRRLHRRRGRRASQRLADAGASRSRL
jgi:hypothetical protein